MAKTADFVKNEYLTSAEQVEQKIKQYSGYTDVYVGLATSLSMQGNRNSVYRRQIIMLDFDRKDFPQYAELKDFVSHLKERLPKLFYHAVTDTGGGYHFYVAVEPTTDCERAAAINRQLAEIAGADVKAALVTQVSRLPTSRNHKYNPPKTVNVILNTYGTPKCKPYKLETLERMIAKVQTHLAAEAEISQQPPKSCNGIRSFYCVENMIASGAPTGARNFCLGRIAAYLRDIKGYGFETAYKTAQEFNSRCSPPKSESELKAQFENWWNNTAYKLLGCTIPDASKMDTLKRYCDNAIVI